ncbi:hypothetical protein HYU94_02735 [Candidatus Daviesbacteria bacterium]|nr:hypothetical protein [Candidatus Daviesbacteria bacterium]
MTEARKDLHESVFQQIKGKQDGKISYTTSMAERVIARSSSLLQVEGLPAGEIIAPTDKQLSYMVYQTLAHLILDRERSGHGTEDWEPAILSVELSVESPRNRSLLDRTDPSHAGIFNRTFKGEDDDITAVTFRYSPGGVDDDRVFADKYAIRIEEESVTPSIVDMDRYEGRRSLPDVKALVETIAAGDIDGSINDLSNLGAGRRSIVSRYIDDVLYSSTSQAETANVLRFLIRGVQQEALSIEDLAGQLSWSIENRNRSRSDLRYVVFRDLPEYAEAFGLIKAHVVPVDEDGTNVLWKCVDSIPWVVKKGALTDEDFQRIADLLPRWAAQLDAEPRNHDIGNIVPTVYSLTSVLMHIAQNKNQSKIALQALEVVKNSKSLGNQTSSIVDYHTSQRLLGSVFE